MPNGSSAVIAYARHWPRTGHIAQMCRASMAGPSPGGKKSSGWVPTQSARAPTCGGCRIWSAPAVADLDQSWLRNSGEDGRPGSVFIVARRASDVIADLCMAGRLNREHYDEDDDSPFRSPDLPDDPEPDWLTESGSVLIPEERYLAEAFRFHYVTDLQEAILARTDASLILGMSMYLEGLAKGDLPVQLGFDLRGIAGDEPRPAPVEPVHAADARTATGRRGIRGLRPADPGPAAEVPVTLAAIQVSPGTHHPHLPDHPS